MGRCAGSRTGDRSPGSDPGRASAVPGRVPDERAQSSVGSRTGGRSPGWAQTPTSTDLREPASTTGAHIAGMCALAVVMAWVGVHDHGSVCAGRRDGVGEISRSAIVCACRGRATMSDGEVGAARTSPGAECGFRLARSADFAWRGARTSPGAGRGRRLARSADFAGRGARTSTGAECGRRLVRGADVDWRGVRTSPGAGARSLRTRRSQRWLKGATASRFCAAASAPSRASQTRMRRLRRPAARRASSRWRATYSALPSAVSILTGGWP
ncbi:hypothetical protein BC793_103289 [Actinoplanes xinjiangensis]|uniref:Uncharacterized protein n=1 Tax=Actinoplanes xinjiangensis TaxID=512350 RepID=A0A316FNS8_9ACTN|nr:hypothetical protein BC793_103289 [Actinoplanes xinjiangensis]